MAAPLDETGPKEQEAIEDSKPIASGASKGYISSEIDRYIDDLYRFAYSVAHHDQEVAKDACHEGVVALLERGNPDMTKYKSLKPYLMKIVRLKVYEIFRRRMRESEGLRKLNLKLRPTEQIGPSESAALRETKARLVQTFLKLPELKRRALYLHVIEGKCYSEIRKELGVSQRTIQEYIRAAREELRPGFIEGELIHESERNARGERAC